jgi:hypothetical protein
MSPSAKRITICAVFCTGIILAGWGWVRFRNEAGVNHPQAAAINRDNQGGITVGIGTLKDVDIDVQAPQRIQEGNESGKSQANQPPFEAGKESVAEAPPELTGKRSAPILPGLAEFKAERGQLVNELAACRTWISGSQISRRHRFLPGLRRSGTRCCG